MRIGCIVLVDKGLMKATYVDPGALFGIHGLRRCILLGLDAEYGELLARHGYRDALRLLNTVSLYSRRLSPR